MLRGMRIEAKWIAHFLFQTVEIKRREWVCRLT